MFSDGHRNVQGLAFDDAGRLWATEFGQNRFDEVNQVRRATTAAGPRSRARAPAAGASPRREVVWTTDEASPSGAAVVGDDLYVAALRGQRLWRVPLDGQGGTGKPVALLEGDYGRLRTVVAAPTARCGSRPPTATAAATPRGRDDRVLRIAGLEAGHTGPVTCRPRGAALGGRQPAGEPGSAPPPQRPRPPAPGRGPLRWFARLVADVVRKADRDRLLGLSAETAFFAVLTLFPALLAATAVLGQLGAFVGRGTALRVEGAVLDFLDQLLTDPADGVIETVRELFDSSGNALTVAALLALVSLSTAFATVVNTVNIAYDVPETRGWWRRRWLGLLLGIGTVITGALAVTLLVVGPLFGRASTSSTRVGLGHEYAFVWARCAGRSRSSPWSCGRPRWTTSRRPSGRAGATTCPAGCSTALLWLGAPSG